VQTRDAARIQGNRISRRASAGRAGLARGLSPSPRTALARDARIARIPFNVQTLRALVQHHPLRSLPRFEPGPSGSSGE
jgi:hypothetical protein